MQPTRRTSVYTRPYSIPDEGTRVHTHATRLTKFSLDKNITIITHDRNYGYGRALKTGIKNSNSDIIFITDIDGTYPNNKIVDFYNKFSEKKCDMLVGARDARSENISLIRKPPKYIINKLANYLVDYKIPDLNSLKRSVFLTEH